MEDKEIHIEKVWFQEDNIYILTSTGEKRYHPLAWFPRLLNASEEERNQFEFSPFGIHWPTLDEDLSFEGFFNYSRPFAKTR